MQTNPMAILVQPSRLPSLVKHCHQRMIFPKTLVFFLVLATCAFGRKKKTTTTRKPKTTKKPEPFFNVAEQNYCRLTCKGTVGYDQNVACECDIDPAEGVTLIETNLQEFRVAVVERFNAVRNNIASGNTHLPKAADMSLVNYDVEMEFIVHCVLKKREYDHWNVCIRTRNTSWLEIYRSVTTKTKPDLNKIGEALDHLNSTLELLKDVTPELVDKAENKGGSLAIYNQHLANAGTDRVGCGRAVNPKEKAAKNKFVVYCLFGNPGGYYDHRVPGHRLYRQGEPCTKCPDGVTCNNKYTALCGKLEPVPKYKWKYSAPNETETSGAYSIGKLSAALVPLLLLNTCQQYLRLSVRDL